MAVSIKDFLELYFGPAELTEALDEIGISAGKTKGERVQKIQKKWTSRRRKWHDLLIYLELEYLAKICDDFKINYYEDDDEEDLIRKIKNSKILSDENVFTEIDEDEDIFEKVEEFEEEISPTKTHEHSFSRPSLTKTIAIGLIVTVVGGIIVLGVWELFFPEISK